MYLVWIFRLCMQAGTPNHAGKKRRRRTVGPGWDESAVCSVYVLYTSEKKIGTCARRNVGWVGHDAFGWLRGRILSAAHPAIPAPLLYVGKR
jgi:hypothetical protein